MFAFYKKWDEFSIFNKERKKKLWTVNMMIESIDKSFC